MRMSRNPHRGRVYRRCACRDDTGKQIGARCPGLSQRRHGRWPSPSTCRPSRHAEPRCVAAATPPKPKPEQVWTGCWSANALHSDDRETVAGYLTSWFEHKSRSLKPTPRRTTTTT
jgi:hypothetical protein